MRGVLFIAALGMLVPAGEARGAEDGNPGRGMYLKYCGACHGPSGKGDGVAGTFMRPKPTDLTQIAKRNGGEFPAQRTMEAIDGRRTVRAHGDPDMPVWGEILGEREGASVHRRAGVEGTIDLITGYIRSIQER
jgi:mono/diheme cytochrome c family protein